MKSFLVTCLVLLVSSTLFAQSKKELQAQVTQLKTETTRLTTDLAKSQQEIQELKKKQEVDLSNPHQKASYGLGILMASQVKKQGGDSLDVGAMTNGIEDVFLNRPLKMEEQKAMMIVQEYMQRATERVSAVAKEESRVFLEKNRTAAGVVVTKSGLQYKVISSGKGKSPGAASSVTVHYTGKLVNGTIFDTSLDDGNPATFTVNQVIPGWTEALQLMHEGDKWMIFIPAELGYGDRGAGGQIPPYAALVFEVELIKVN